MADDLDADTRGPSLCDPVEDKERGVFRALRKVYASFYNDNAFLERLRHQVEETQVGMAVLVHHSTPDASEEANGVATLRVDKAGTRYLNGDLVTQAGAVSVTNPDSAAVPESVSFSQFEGTPFLTLEQPSSLVPLGASVLRWEADYRALINLLNSAAQGYEAEFPAKRALTLNFEYKRVSPGSRLLLKQVREVPAPSARPFTPWLLDASATYEVFQGERGDVVSKHRLKSLWQFEVRPTRVDDAGLSTTPFLHVRGETRDGSNAVVQVGPPESLPGHVYRRTADEWVDRWTQGNGPAQREFALRVSRIRETTAEQGPLLLLRDHAIACEVKYATPQPTLVYDPLGDTFKGGTTTQETVSLTPVQWVGLESIRQQRTLKHGVVTVQTAFWWPPVPKGPTAGYTAPVQAWIETRITGLTRESLVLHSPWAQTYQPGHHNFFEDFAFEPQRDPGVTAEQRAELAAANIKAIILGASPFGDGQPSGFVWGLDDRFRPL